MSINLTVRQKEILDFIENFIEVNSYPPTYREIGKEFDIVSTFGVKRHIDALVKKGYLLSESNTSRTLSLVNNQLPEKDDNNLTIPLIGRVAAGYPILAEENIEGTISVDLSLIKGNNVKFGLKVQGDSMINAGILEGDIVFVSDKQKAKNGDIIIAQWENEATLKRYERIKDQINLIPENEKYSVINLKNPQGFYDYW